MAHEEKERYNPEASFFWDQQVLGFFFVLVLPTFWDENELESDSWKKWEKNPFPTVKSERRKRRRVNEVQE